MKLSKPNVSASLLLISTYLFLIGMSWFIQLSFPKSDKPNVYEESQTILFKGEKVEVDYFLVGQQPGRSVALYLSDIYHGAQFLIPIAEKDTTESTRIILEYPQYNLNGNELSHSIESQSKIAALLLDSLNIDSVSIRGHGYGGLPAIHLLSNNDQVKQRTKDLVLLTSFGVQELQFLGNYSFNKSIYSILHGITKTAEYLLPHMGYFYQQPFQDQYTKALLEMDQRDVRDQLKSIDVPVLIVHPVNDSYISNIISLETHRLIPQSYFVSPPGTHEIYFSEPETIVKQLNWFIELSKTDDLSTRVSAGDERISNSKTEFDPNSVQKQNRSTLALLGFMVILIATFSEDLGVISAGLLVASGLIPYWFAIMVTILGIFIVDMSIYLLGRYVGRPVIERAPFKWFIKERDVESAENTFNMRGIELIFLSRFLPGARLPVYLVAGILQVNFTFFLTFFFLAIIIWAPLLVWLSAFVGQPILGYLNAYQDYALWVFFGIMFIIYLVIKLVIPLTTLKGRLRLVIKWRRFKERLSG